MIISHETRIVVTGGSGFLGKHLCRTLLAQGYQVKNIDLKDNAEVETVIADICDKEKMKTEMKDSDIVFHLAALIEAGESVKDPQRFVDTNISGSLSVLNAMKENGVKTLIFSSSAAIYGEPIKTPIQEDDRTIAINPYGMTKMAMEGLLSSYVASYGMTGIALRYFNLYGPGEAHEPETHAIPRFVKQIYENQEVTVWGQGEHQRDFIHIQDVVSAHLSAIDLAFQQPNLYHYFNLSAEEPTSVAQVIVMLEEIMKKKAQLNYFPSRPGDPLILVADATKAHKILGWKAEIPLYKGLKETVDYLVESFQEKK